MQTKKRTLKHTVALLCGTLMLSFSTAALSQTENVNSGSDSVQDLASIYALAKKHDAVLAQAHSQYLAEQQNLDVAEAALLPTIQASASLTKIDGELDSSDMTAQEASLSLTQPLYNPKTQTAYDQVKLVLKEAQYRYQSAEQQLILRVTEQYLAVLLAKQTLELAQAKEDSDKAQLERAKAATEVGLASQVDVLQAKSSFDLSMAERMNAENQHDIAQEMLRKLIGQSVGELKAFGENVDLDFDIDNIQQWVTKAEGQNLVVKQQQAQVKRAQEEVTLQKAEYWPTLQLQAQLSDSQYSDVGAGASFNDNRKTSVGLSLSMPIYQGGARSAKVTAARHALQASREGLRDAKEQAALDARVQIRNLQRGVALIAALQEAVNSNQAFVNVAEEGHKVGLKSMLEVLVARSNLFVAKKNLVEAIHNQVLNKFRLEAALGELNEQDLQAINEVLVAAEDKGVQ